MGARQSSVAEERPRSNSVDTVRPSTSEQTRTASNSVMSAAEFLQAIRNHARLGSSSDFDEDEDSGTRSSAMFPSTMRLQSNWLSADGHPPGRLRSHLARRSAPVFSSGEDLTCPVCHKVIPSDETDFHLVMCLTRPRLTYNDDVLTEAKGECSICLEEMDTGDLIARLPCLCIYHKQCIDDWFKRKNCCPEHPGEE